MHYKSLNMESHPNEKYIKEPKKKNISNSTQSQHLKNPAALMKTRKNNVATT